MRRTSHLFLSFTTFAFISACGGEQPRSTAEQAGGGTTPAIAPVAGTTGTVPNSNILREQLTVAEKQIGLGRVASVRAAQPDVKQLAQNIVTDYERAAGQLRDIVQRNKLTVATDPNQLAVERDRLGKISGAAFDREFLDEIITDHQDAVRDLEAVARDENRDIRDWAAATLPVMRRHLEQARQLRQAAPAK